MLCVHVGNGQLGLGLIVEQLLEAKFDVCLVGRPAEPIHESFGVAFTNPSLGLKVLTTKWVSNAALVDKLPREVLAVVDSNEPMLITVSLKDGIAERETFIVDLVERRPTGVETVLLACENDVNEVYERIAKRLAGKVIVPECVVDRICSWRSKKRKTDRHGRRVVRAHATGEWTVAVAEPVPEVLTRLANAELVSLVAPPIDGWKARKLWSVNGIHIILALIARIRKIDDLPLEDDAARLFVDRARSLMSAIAEGVTGEWPDVLCDGDYVEARIRAFVESPDETTRLIGDYLVREDLRPFMRRLDRRVAAAARKTHEAGGNCEPFYDAMALVLEALRSSTNYYTPKTPMAVDDAVDAEVVRLFAAVLEPWLDERRATALVDTLRVVLGSERDRRAPEADEPD